MKILFFSDVHGSPDALALMESQMAGLNPELLVLLGDVLYHGPRNRLREDYAPQKVVAMLNPMKNKLIAVRGNCDCEVDQMLLRRSRRGRFLRSDIRICPCWRRGREELSHSIPVPFLCRREAIRLRSDFMTEAEFPFSTWKHRMR